MNNLWLRAAVGVTRVWTRLYTAGMAPELRDRRRAEIESDIWESSQQLDRSSPGHVLMRLLLGMPDDVFWRCSHRHAALAVCYVILSGLATGVVVAALVFLVSLGSATRLPTPEPVFHRVRALPPPPPPPPPPCMPPELGRTSPSPCTR